MQRSQWLVRLPRRLYTAEQVRELDRQAVQECGIPGLELMTRAAAAMLRQVQSRWPQLRRVLVFAGTGNNAGDGYLLAALAAAEGLRAEVLEAGDFQRLGADAAAARARAQAAGVLCMPLSEAGDRAQAPGSDTVVIDALLGIGGHGALRPAFLKAVQAMNAMTVPVVAVDIPSGLCPDTGTVSEVAVRATLTVCFIALKQGLLTGSGPDHAGEIVVEELELPARVLDSAVARRPACERIDIHSESSQLRPRTLSAHKGDAGHVLVIGGDLGFGGAALMAAEAACRTGAGTTALLTRAVHVSAALARRPEIMTQALEALEDNDWQALVPQVRKASAVVIGPGLGRSSWSRALLRKVLQSAGTRVPLVLDADALSLLAEGLDERQAITPAGDTPHGLHKRQWILTPHPGEAARLLGMTSAQVQADRFAAVRQLQARWGGVCLLKGIGSVVCHDSGKEQHVALCTEGNPGMASGGMGDVLSGILGSLLAQGTPAPVALRLGVCLHGEAADLAAAADGERGLLATDLLPHIRHLMNRR